MSLTFLDEMHLAMDRISASDLFLLKNKIFDAKDTIFILGNGGSNAIASHMAEDYTKQISRPTISFSDAPRLSCYANDYGYENTFSKFLEHFASPKSLVILISSSGESKNILNAAKWCVSLGVEFVTLTGFSSANSLRKISEESSKLSFWVDSRSYGVVECSHEIILHSVVS